MANKRAKTLTEEQFETLLAFTVQRSKVPESDRLKLLLSFKAGLRACEIARIKVVDLVDSSGRPAPNITVFGGIAKGGKERTVPMHPTIQAAVTAFKSAYPTAKFVALTPRRRRGRPASMTANAITQWFWRLYREAGFSYASSHSGRRTFATNAARKLADHPLTLVDVQRLLGHARLDTTAAYIEPSASAFSLVSSL